MKTSRLALIVSIAALLTTALACEQDAAEGAGEQEQASAVESEAQAEQAAEGEEGEEGAAVAEVAPKDKADEAAPVAKVGSPAPAFTLTDTTGKAHSLADYKGKTVVLEWTSQSCPYVVRHYDDNTMAKTHEAVGKDDVVWLTIDSTHNRPAEELKTWKAEKGLAQPILADKDGSVGKLYEAKTTPHMYVIDAEGVLRYNGAIDNNPHGDTKPEEVVNYVEQAVTAVLKGEAPEKAQTKPYGCSVKYKS